MEGLSSLENKTEIEYNEDLRLIKEEIAAKKQEYYDGNKGDNNTDFCGHAFVTLNSEYAKNALIDN